MFFFLELLDGTGSAGWTITSVCNAQNTRRCSRFAVARSLVSLRVICLTPGQSSGKVRENSITISIENNKIGQR